MKKLSIFTGLALVLCSCEKPQVSYVPGPKLGDVYDSSFSTVEDAYSSFSKQDWFDGTAVVYEYDSNQDSVQYYWEPSLHNKFELSEDLKEKILYQIRK